MHGAKTMIDETRTTEADVGGNTGAAGDARAIVLDWFQHIMDRKDWTGTDLARNSKLAPSTILRMLNDPNHQFRPSLKTLQKVAEGSGYPIPRKIMNALGAHRFEAPDAAEEASGERLRVEVGQALTHVLPKRGETRRRKMLKLKQVWSLPSAIHPVVKDDVLIECPFPLESDETAFAFYMPDSGLDPWLPPGTMMFGKKSRDPEEGDMVLVTDKSGRSKVRLLVAMNEKGMNLTKCNPPQGEEKIAFDDLAEVSVVAIVHKM
jgi:transcriptional regulator with XRE-family HTH domain